MMKAVSMMSINRMMPTMSIVGTLTSSLYRMVASSMPIIENHSTRTGSMVMMMVRKEKAKTVRGLRGVIKIFLLNHAFMLPMNLGAFIIINSI